MKQAAIFDMDGLLFDTERIYQAVWAEMPLRFGLTPSPEFPSAVCGTGGDTLVRLVREHYPAVEPQDFIARGIARVHEIIRQNPVPKKPGLHEILAFFRENGVKIAVASSSDRALIESNLRRAGIDSYFDAIVSGAHMKRSKPAPDIFLEAARQLGCDPADCYVFEDGVNGCKAGIAAGCTTVMIPDLVQPDDALRARCAAVCGSLLEVCGAIRRGLL
ncbi:MAG: HAD family hydrolase [Butyricicoccus sp.]